MKKLGHLTGTFLCSLLVLTACSHADASKKTENPAPAASTAVSDKASQSKTVLSIDHAEFNQNSESLIVNVQMKNESNSAQSLKPDSFELMIDNKSLTPDAKSEIPQQVPGEATASLKLVFDKKDLEGEKNIKLAFQPADQSKQVLSIGSITINKTEQATASNNNTESDNKTTETTNVSAASAETPIVLETQKVGPVFIKVPKGWVKSPHKGDGIGGYDYTNPNDKNETMQVVYFACTGCGYPNGDPGSADPHPLNLIPASNVTDSFVFSNRLSAGYAYDVPGNPNKGNGVVTMVQGEGYAYAQIVLPESSKPVAREILNSFAFHGVY